MKYVLLLIGFLISLCTMQGQSITYTLDPNFDAGEKIRGVGAVDHILPLEDGGFFLGGSFDPINQVNSPFDGALGMLSFDGSLHPLWNGIDGGFARELHIHDGGYLYPSGQTLLKCTYFGESWFTLFGDTWGDYFKAGDWGLFNNPYNVEWVWDIYIQEDQSVLIGGAIATDTLQPNLFRHLCKLNADGSHDDTFPIIEAMPQGLSTYVSAIEKGSNGYWYISGRFEGINGHYSPHIVRLTENFDVDTDFVSPFVFESISTLFHTDLEFIDSQDRLWMTGLRVRLQDVPDTFALVRLLPDGSVDESFFKAKISDDHPEEWQDISNKVREIIEFDSSQGIFFVCGSFSIYNDTAQSAITAINGNGYILENYFQGMGATANEYHVLSSVDIREPSLSSMTFLPDGSLMVGGGFSEFMGEERYGIVKLQQGTINTENTERKPSVKLYPNPADQWMQLEYELLFEKPNTVMNIYDELGRKVESRTIGQNLRGMEIFDTRKLQQGLYIVEIVQEGKQVFTDKFMVQR